MGGLLAHTSTAAAAPVGYAAAACLSMLAAALLLFQRLVERETFAKPRVSVS